MSVGNYYEDIPFLKKHSIEGLTFTSEWLRTGASRRFLHHKGEEGFILLISKISPGLSENESGNHERYRLIHQRLITMQEL